MIDEQVVNEYFEWLTDIVDTEQCGGSFGFDKLLSRLHEIEFTYLIAKDCNRAEDGISLRYRYAQILGYEDEPNIITDILDGPCSVLEMMIALAMRCEEYIMDDTSYGDRTSQWFWNMIVNLGLGSMSNGRYDRRTVDFAIVRFLNRDYDPNGEGGLFTIRHCDKDLRDVEIWYQLCWYLNSIS